MLSLKKVKVWLKTAKFCYWFQKITRITSLQFFKHFFFHQRAQVELGQVRQEIDRRLQEKEEEFNNARKVHQKTAEQMQAHLESECKAKAEVLHSDSKWACISSAVFWWTFLALLNSSSFSCSLRSISCLTCLSGLEIQIYFTHFSSIFWRICQLHCLLHIVAAIPKSWHI